MPILSPESSGPAEPHRAREVAESFGADAEAYHRSRPRYPTALAEAVLRDVPGREAGEAEDAPGAPDAPNRLSNDQTPHILDVGCGTGISSEPFRALGARVLGVDPDGRMAARARAGGLDVEVARFEDWDAGDRSFDAVISGQTWHWVDPEKGPAKARAVLRPGGLIALFWNAATLPADLVERVTGFGFPREALTGAAYDAMAAWAAKNLARDFTGLTTTAFPWSAAYTRDEWLGLAATTGVRDRLDLGGLRANLPETVDVEYRTILVTGVRAG